MPRRLRPDPLTGSLLLAVATALLLAGLYAAKIQPGLFAREGHHDAAALAVAAQYPVFAYATLRSDAVRLIVTGRRQATEPARLPGFRREGRTIVPDPDGMVEGLRVTVGPAELARLDRYERVGIVYERVLLPLADGTSAWVYRFLPDPAGVATSRP